MLPMTSRLDWQVRHSGRYVYFFVLQDSNKRTEMMLQIAKMDVANQSTLVSVVPCVVQYT